MTAEAVAVPVGLPTADDDLAVSVRELDRHAYAHDASHYLLTPRAVLTPTDTAAVAKLLSWCHRNRAPLTFRSGGTSLSGQGVTDGLLVDTRKHFRGFAVRDDGRRVACRPGATVRQVNAALARYGRKLGPDPASEVACTIGGVVANNSSGMACGTEFNTYRTLASMIMVLPDGTTIDTAAPDADDRLHRLRPELVEGLERLRRRILDNASSVEILRRQFAMKNTMGYGLNAFLDHSGPVDVLAHLMVGSEGTLGFVAEATFDTVPVHGQVGTGLLIFPRLADAAAALPELTGQGLSTIELLDATSLRVAQGLPAASDELRALDVGEHTALLVEIQAATADELGDRRAALSRLTDSLPLVGSSVLTTDPGVAARLWKIRKGLYTTVADARPSGTNALLEDIAVPVPALHDTCAELNRLLAEHGYTDGAVIFGHAKDGNLHFMLTERFDDRSAMQRYARFTDDLVELVLGHQGTLKAEHGTGRIMAPFVERQYGTELYQVMCELKHLVDPHRVLNPEAVLSDEPDSYLRHLKTQPTVEPEVDRCVECGYCENVCPSKNLTLTPRQRIVLRRELAAAQERGDTELARRLADDYDYDGLDTCAVDGMCATACPVGINTGDLVRRLRQERNVGLTRRGGRAAARHWAAITVVAGRALDVAGAVPALPRAATRVGRRLLGEDLVPLYDPGLPRGGRRRRASRGSPGLHGSDGSGAGEPVAVYFPSCLGAVFAPGAGDGVQAAVERLTGRAGLAVRIPDRIDRLCCGTPWTSKGLPEGLEQLSDRVLPALVAATENGRLPVLVDASSCAHGLAALVASVPELAVRDVVDFAATDLLPRLTVVQRLPSLLLHPTCSSVQAGSDALRTIAAAIAEDVVVPQAWGCCAFAGDRGLLHPELTGSATAAEAAEADQRSYTAYASDNRTCEIGLERATGRPYQHVLQLLDRVTTS